MPIPALTGADLGALGMSSPAIAEPWRVEYRVAERLPELPGPAEGYRLASTATPERVTRLAAAFGLSGAVRTDGSGWSVTGSAGSVRVERAGGLPWSFTPAGGGSVGSTGCAVAVPGGPAGAPGASAAPVTMPTPCPSPTPVPGLPSRAVAEARGRAVLANAGLDLGGAVVRLLGGVTGWAVTVDPAVDGVPVVSSASWWVSIGPRGSLLFSWGWLAVPRHTGDYPLVGVSTGLDRLRQGGRWILRPGPGPVPLNGGSAVPQRLPATANAVAPGSSAVVAPAAPRAVAPASLPTVTPLPAPVPTPMLPPPGSRVSPRPAPTAPPLIVRTVTAVHLGLAWGTPVDAPAGDAWLVPAYMFEVDGGIPLAVLAVSDRLVAPPSTPAVTAVPAPGPSFPVPAAPLPANPAPEPRATGR